MWNGTRMNATAYATIAPATQPWLAAITPAVDRHPTHAASAPPPTGGATTAGTDRARRSCSSDHRIIAREFIARSIPRGPRPARVKALQAIGSQGDRGARRYSAGPVLYASLKCVKYAS